MTRFIRSLVTVAVTGSFVAALAGTAKADFTITVAPTSAVSPWGQPGASTPTYGETFSPVAFNPYLQSITYSINNPNGAAIPFQAYVYAWTGTQITGGALYTSSLLSAPANGASYTNLTVSNMNTLLTPGNQYVAFYTTLNLPGTGLGGASYQNAPDTAYAGGTFVYNNTQTFAGLATPTWNDFGNIGDLALTFNFTSAPAGGGGIATPVPPTLAVGLVAGLGGLGGLWRRRRAAAA